MVLASEDLAQHRLLLLESEVPAGPRLTGVDADAAWHVERVESVREATNYLARVRVDALVLSSRLATVGELGLLCSMRERSPDTARIVLTDSAMQDNLREAERWAHRVLPAPCRADRAMSAVSASIVARRTRLSPRLEQVTRSASMRARRMAEYLGLDGGWHVDAAGLEYLLSQEDELVGDVQALLRSGHFDSAEDLRFGAPVLDGFGAPVVRDLAFMSYALTFYADAAKAGVDFGALLDDAVGGATFAHKIAIGIGLTTARAYRAFQAALFRDLGLLVLAAYYPGEVETGDLGDLHPLVGAAVLEDLGLPDVVTEAVALHHGDATMERALDIADAVAMADAMHPVGRIAPRFKVARPPRAAGDRSP